MVRPPTAEWCRREQRHDQHDEGGDGNAPPRSNAGVYSQMLRLCQRRAASAPAAAPSSSAARSASRPRAAASSSLSGARLASAIQRVVDVPLRRGDVATARVRFAQVTRAYLRDVQPCLVERAGHMELRDAAGAGLVWFRRRIGSDSINGVAYMNTGLRGAARHLRFSCKLMSTAERAHTLEAELLGRMSRLVEEGVSPNMPLVFLSLVCKRRCELPSVPCPAVTTEAGYHVVLNELASTDLQGWLTKAHAAEQYESVTLQVLLAVHAFHERLRHVHRDCHLGNFLMHTRVPAGGYWHYRVGGLDAYVPNAGVLVTLWDPGYAKPEPAAGAGAGAVAKYNGHRVSDYYRPLALMCDVDDHPSLVRMGLRAPPQRVRDGLLRPLIDALSARGAAAKVRGFMRDALERMRDGSLSCASVRVGAAAAPARADVLNAGRPYVLDAVA